MKPARHLGLTLAILLLFGACMASKRAGGACSCGGERPPSVVPAAEATGALPAPAALPRFDAPEWTHLRSRAGTYELCWRALGGEIPRNQEFALEVWVLRDEKPVRDANLSVTAWMPEHGHGMLRRPLPERRTDGSFLVDGMLLHMRGHWEIFFEVLEGTLSETADYALDL